MKMKNPCYAVKIFAGATILMVKISLAVFHIKPIKYFYAVSQNK